MKFRTEIEPIKSDIALSIDKPLAFVGSCFADNISARMRRCLWQAENPLGVLFNPMSIVQALRIALLKQNPINHYNEYIFSDGDIAHSWLLDTSFSGKPDMMPLKFINARDRLDDILRHGRTLFVTFGTAICYYLKSKPVIVVANCHKQPAALFKRRPVSIEEITDVWSELIPELEQVYPGLHIIFTVSPVRHVRDGLHENQLSKSTLLIAVNKLCNKFANCHYFPAYEIVNDDLRDYRFYAADLVHPSDSAVEYIWEKLLDTYISETECRELTEGEKIAKRASHRPIIADSSAAADFTKTTEKLYAEFAARHPFIINL